MRKPLAGAASSVKKRISSVTQKRVKKSTPSVQKIKITNNVAIKKTQPKKKIVVKALKEDTRKIEIIENITKRKAATKTPKTTVLAASRISLALMVPFKLPLDQSLLASNVARYAGTAFIMIGAFFTLFNMGEMLTGANATERMMAQTTASTCTTPDCPTTQTTISNSDSTDQTYTVTTQQPQVDIRVESSTQEIKGIVKVSVTVPSMDRVELYAYNTVGGSPIKIGSMDKINDSLWGISWDTTKTNDGPYKLKATVYRAQYYSYTAVSSNSYTVTNHPIDTTTAAGTGTVTTSTSGSSNINITSETISSSTALQTTDTSTIASNDSSTITSTTTDALPLPSLRVLLGMQEPLKGKVSIRTLVEGASAVPLYVRKTNTTNSTLLGYGYLHEPGEWRYDWDTTRFSDGDYDLKIQAILPDKRTVTQSFQGLTIANTASNASGTLEILETDTSSTTPKTVTTSLEPSISILLSEKNPLSDQVDVFVNAPSLSFVELYVLPERSITPRFLGLAERQSDTSWRYRFDTQNVPNGYYTLFAKVRHPYGDSEGGKMQIRIENVLEETDTEEEVQYIDTLKATGVAVEALAPQVMPPDDSDEVSDTPAPLSTIYTVIKEDMPEEFHEETENLIEAFRDELNRIMRAYGTALRENDEEEIRALQNELEELRKKVISEMPSGEDRDRVVTRINEQLGSIIKDLRERVERTETLIKERVGEAVTKDSDSDGISDYDEVNLYETDPFSSDTDQDGFIDGIEILNGYDPLDEEREANVQYESPREEGIVREDLLKIDYITTVETEKAEDTPKAQIAGKALPNSFVTLYIFSTPIVVTVKADANGNWSYIFDKELENGDHEVYVGITDNAGKIVAKSNPLAFVKTAQAFTPVDAEASAVITTEPSEPSLVSRSALLVVSSLAVVSLGLVLILLGLHVRPKDPEVQMT